MNKLILVRGLPGSGKSYLAEKLQQEFIKAGLTCSVYSTDDFFVYDNNYNFDPTLLSVAHTWNRGRVMRSMMKKVDVIIVANTFTKTWEVEPYYNDSKKFGYTLELKQPKTAWAFDKEECFKRNTHGVPLEVIDSMVDRWESTEQIVKALESKDDSAV